MCFLVYYRMQKQQTSDQGIVWTTTIGVNLERSRGWARQLQAWGVVDQQAHYHAVGKLSNVWMSMV